MASTTIAVLHAGAVPVFWDVDPQTWLMAYPADYETWAGGDASNLAAMVPVSLYGLNDPHMGSDWTIDDAAQTLRRHCCAFTSYSFQASKILALGEGGMLVTDSEELATRAREFSSLGYRMRADQPRIDPAALKSPTYERHHTYPAWNYRMSDLVAEEGLRLTQAGTTGFRWVDMLLEQRRKAASFYRDAIAGCDWLTPQHVPEGWHHDYWSWAVAFRHIEHGEMASQATFWNDFAGLIVKHGGSRPYAAWRLTYQEPAFTYLHTLQLASIDYRERNGASICPVAEDLQPRLMQFQTNNLTSAERNAEALRKAIREIGG
jgi:perosamine synthetase